MIGRNDPCWCGSGAKWKKCHSPALPPDADHQILAEQYRRQYHIHLKTDEEIEGMRKACRFSASVLKKLCTAAKAGVTTDEINDLANKLHADAGYIPASLNYGNPPFPKSICTSLNEVVCHGIPDGRPLAEGDIVNIDIASIVEGFYGDCSGMVVVGSTTPERQLVVDVSYESLMKAIEILKPGIPVCKIGNTIEDYAVPRGCSVVHQFVGHGIGRRYHEAPQIPHGYNEVNIPLAAGMIFTIEPMINAGSAECIIDPDDQWTARTVDGKASAQWEHTILITPTGYEILTL